MQMCIKVFKVLVYLSIIVTEAYGGVGGTVPSPTRLQPKKKAFSPNCQTEDSFEKLNPSLDCALLRVSLLYAKCVHILLEIQCKNGNCGRIALKISYNSSYF